MNTLTVLKERMEAIPGKRKGSDLVEKLKQYREQAQKILLTTERVLAGRNGLMRVFADSDVSPLDEKVQKVGNIANRLADQLKKTPDKVNSPATSDRFASMTDMIGGSEKFVKKRWSELILDKTEGFQGLVNAAKEASLPGHKDMTASLTYLVQAANIPPTTQELADAARNALENLKTAITGLGLAGSPGKFLMQAAQGMADLSLLDDIDVRNFIKEHHLERLIKIKLG